MFFMGFHMPMFRHSRFRPTLVMRRRGRGDRFSGRGTRRCKLGMCHQGKTAGHYSRTQPSCIRRTGHEDLPMMENRLHHPSHIASTGSQRIHGERSSFADTSINVVAGPCGLHPVAVITAMDMVIPAGDRMRRISGSPASLPAPWACFARRGDATHGDRDANRPPEQATAVISEIWDLFDSNTVACCHGAAVFPAPDCLDWRKHA